MNMSYPFLFSVYFIVNFLFRVAVTIIYHAVIFGCYFLFFKFIGLFVNIPISFTQFFWDLLPIALFIYSLAWLVYLAWKSAIISWNEGFHFKFSDIEDKDYTQESW